MNKHSRKPSTSGLLYLAAVSASLTFPFAAHAANDPTKYECNLNGSLGAGYLGCINAGSGGGTNTTLSAVTNVINCKTTPEASLPSVFGTNFCGANSPATSTSVVPIYAWNVCRWVDNNNTSSASYDGHFVPLGTPDEWAAFRTNAPAGISLPTCAIPYSIQNAAAPGTPATTNIMEYGTGKLTAGVYENCTATYSVANPEVYGKTNISVWPTSPTIIGSPSSSPISCNSGNTRMMAAPQFIAGTWPDSPTTTLSWNANSKYSPDVDLSISTAMPVEEGQPVTINWTVTPHPNAAGAAVTCSVSPAGWGPGASFTGATTGSQSVIPGSGTTAYTLTCSTDSPALTSVASSAATTYAPSPPCCWG